jgi:hypothetical protein
MKVGVNFTIILCARLCMKARFWRQNFVRKRFVQLCNFWCQNFVRKKYTRKTLMKLAQGSILPTYFGNEAKQLLGQLFS